MNRYEPEIKIVVNDPDSKKNLVFRGHLISEDCEHLTLDDRLKGKIKIRRKDIFLLMKNDNN